MDKITDFIFNLLTATEKTQECMCECNYNSILTFSLSLFSISMISVATILTRSVSVKTNYKKDNDFLKRFLNDTEQVVDYSDTDESSESEEETPFENIDLH
jgi:ribosomal protein S18